MRRLVTIAAGDWRVRSLQPLSEIRADREQAGGSIALSKVVDLQEMGVPDGLVGTVMSISACPAIESGPGRVVLATVNHLNDFVFHLTLTDGRGDDDTIGVTGYHRIYTEDRGWVVASELHLGEEVRAAHGDVKVAKLLRDPGAFTVYNMTVEVDHVFYVGDLSALVHNTCGENSLLDLAEELGGKAENATSEFERLSELAMATQDEALANTYWEAASQAQKEAFGHIRAITDILNLLK